MENCINCHGTGTDIAYSSNIEDWGHSYYVSCPECNKAATALIGKACKPKTVLTPNDPDALKSIDYEYRIHGVYSVGEVIMLKIAEREIFIDDMILDEEDESGDNDYYTDYVEEIFSIRYSDFLELYTLT